MPTIVTISQPIISPAYGALATLTIAVLDRCYGKPEPLPAAIKDMLPCVDDALASHDDDYIELIHTLFGRVLEDVMDLREVML